MPNYTLHDMTLDPATGRRKFTPFSLTLKTDNHSDLVAHKMPDISVVVYYSPTCDARTKVGGYDLLLQITPYRDTSMGRPSTAKSVEEFNRLNTHSLSLEIASDSLYAIRAAPSPQVTPTKDIKRIQSTSIGGSLKSGADLAAASGDARTETTKEESETIRNATTIRFKPVSDNVLWLQVMEKERWLGSEVDEKVVVSYNFKTPPDHGKYIVHFDLKYVEYNASSDQMKRRYVWSRRLLKRVASTFTNRTRVKHYAGGKVAAEDSAAYGSSNFVAGTEITL